MHTHTLLDRFLRYVRIDTTADEKSTTYPSSPGQLVLGKLLRDELLAMGLTDAVQNEHGIVFATIPGNVAGAPTIAFNSHVDTSPETTGKNVDPQVIRDYPGGDIVLPKDKSKVIRVTDSPELTALVGKTIITTDGTTLLGGDDKAGVAVIMELARILAENPTIPHGPIRVVFTCDEEIGKGVLHLDPKDIGAVVGYTLDGQGVGELEAETFSADKATVTITGVNIHPGIAKGKMVNAVRLVGEFLEKLPKNLSPEKTADREGFQHPYIIEGGVGKTTLHVLLRDHDTAKLAEYADLLRAAAKAVMTTHPAANIDVTITQQYRNMREGIEKEPRAMAYAEQAVKRAGQTPKHCIIRGGTDGAMLTAKGLPTPNISTGEHNIHSPLEWVCLEELDANVRVLIELVQVWAGR
ncbi:peptidase T [Limnoglobus roseus]|uniref:Peptidase T n=1 Tax=Limnoglobus roseus TaxID=2598579 RepID=A0A5C1AA31_9BACT|nr:peptidase T [Limnoglobus roseus]QEL15425.1 peptidase T [Limnoglobus roseus]